MEESVLDWAAKNIQGQCSSVDEANEKMQMAAKYCRLIGGAAQIPLVMGHSIVFSVIPIDKAGAWVIKGRDDESPRKRGVPGVTVDEIGCALGIEWEAPVREDDAKDPLFCIMTIAGRYRQVDGTYRPIKGRYTQDAREGSYQLAGKPPIQVSMIRAKVVERAETGARHRAIRGHLAVPHSVLESELDIPFVCARLQFTGQAEDPVLRAMFGMTIVQDRLLAMRSVYGEQATEGIRESFPMLLDIVKAIPMSTLPTSDGKGHAQIVGRIAPPSLPEVQPEKMETEPEDELVPSGPSKGKRVGELSDEALIKSSDMFKEQIAQNKNVAFFRKWLAVYSAVLDRRHEAAANDQAAEALSKHPSGPTQAAPIRPSQQVAVESSDGKVDDEFDADGELINDAQDPS